MSNARETLHEFLVDVDAFQHQHYLQQRSWKYTPGLLATSLWDLAWFELAHRERLSISGHVDAVLSMQAKLVHMLVWD